MKKQLKTILILLIVIAVLHIVGGIVYISFTAAEDKRYTSVECTISEVNVSKSEANEDGEGENVTIESVVVTYKNAQGELVEARLADFPQSFEVGSVLNGRYKDDAHSITLDSTDWFTPSLVLFIGGMYGIGAGVLFATRRKAGMYALDTEAQDKAPEVEEDEQGSYEPAQGLDSSIFADDEK